jgi:hypothetical protein
MASVLFNGNLDSRAIVRHFGLLLVIIGLTITHRLQETYIYLMQHSCILSPFLYIFFVFTHQLPNL